MTRHYLALAAALAATAFGTLAARGQSAGSPTRIVFSGTAAPAGGSYSGFSTPALNNSGQLAFRANLSGGSSSVGIFAGAAGSVQAVALQGTAAPAGGNYNDFGGSVINEAGQVAFINFFNGGSSGIFAGAPGSVQAVAIQGAAAPSGGNYTSLGFANVLNDSGQVAFTANLSGGSSTNGLFVGAPGSVQAIALQGTAAPAGGNYQILRNPLTNNSGQVAFSSDLSGGSSTRGIFIGNAGSVQAVALQGTAAPGGGTYTGLNGAPAINNAGQVAFTDRLGNPDGLQSGVFAGAPGSVQAIAIVGNATPAGGTYNGFNPLVAINGSGQVAFLAGVDGLPGGGFGGVFAGTAGSVQAYAIEGTAAPGGGNYEAVDDPVINGIGQVAFDASLAGPGVTSANDFGLYAGTPGSVVKIVRTGDLVDVDPTQGVDLRTVADFAFLFNGSGGEDGRGVALNDNGLFAYTLFFTDGSSGVFTTQLTPVPEPAGLLLAATAGLAGFRRVRRHFRHVPSSIATSRTP